MNDEGASSSDRILAACRSGSRGLVEDILSECDDEEQELQLLNTAKDSFGRYCLHSAAMNGHYSVVDLITDRDGLELDYTDSQGNTALHKAIVHINKLEPENWETDSGNDLARFLISLGIDATIKNQAGKKAVDLVDSRNQVLRSYLNTQALAKPQDTTTYDAESEEEDQEGSEPGTRVISI